MEALTNIKLYDLNAKYIGIGTDEIKEWTEGEPFIIALNTEEDFYNNGFDYPLYEDMSVGEMRGNDDFKGVYVIRMK